MPHLSLSQIRKSYGRKIVLDGITQDFPVGLTLLIGPSGAGKSTLLRLLATAEKPNAGTVSWDGARLPAARSALRATLGYAPQAVDLPEDLTAREFALHMASLKGLDAGAADTQFGAITDAIGLHADINNRISTFSGGMGAPQLLALDEPTAELDGETAHKLGALIMERAKTAVVVMTTHLADELAPNAAQVLRVEAGQVSAA
jgi:ABC-2 type transport system ATP-binding protein